MPGDFSGGTGFGVPAITKKILTNTCLLEDSFLTMYHKLRPTSDCLSKGRFSRRHRVLPEDGDVFPGTPDGRAILLGGLSPLALLDVLMAPRLSLGRGELA